MAGKPRSQTDLASMSDEDLIRHNYRKILEDLDAPAAAKAAAGRNLRAMNGGGGDGGLGGMTRAEIEAELEECRAMLGRSP